MVKIIALIHLYSIKLVISILCFFHLQSAADRVALHGLRALLRYLRKINLAQYIHARRRIKQEHPEHEFP
jgi:hypothetical protein